MFYRILCILSFCALVLMGCAPAFPAMGPTSAVGQGTATVRGRVVWGGEPVAGARVELRTGAWAINTDPPVAIAVTDADGTYELGNVPEGEFGLVAVWPEGDVNTAPVTPVQVPAGATVEDMTVYLARELAPVTPISGAVVEAEPILQWLPLPEAARYRVMVLDAGTTELLLDAEVAETEAALPQPLTPGRTYDWTVNALAADGALLGSLTSSFSVAAEAVSAKPTTPCQQTFERRELHEPYQRRGGQARHTLAADELAAFLADMGIVEVCFPPELGAPFVNVDWRPATAPGTHGQMASLGLEGAYTGAGWSDVYVLAASYDFATGSEYDTFATPTDRDGLRSGALAAGFFAGERPGLVRIQPSLYALGDRPVFKTWVLPLEEGYVAVVCDLGAWPADTDWDALLQDLERGAIPPERQASVTLAEALARSLRLAHAP